MFYYFLPVIIKTNKWIKGGLLRSMKKLMNKIEVLLEKWLKPIPRLPESFRKWLATNLWIIVLVGVVISIVSIIVSFVGLVAILSWLGTATRSLYGYYIYAHSYSSWSAVTAIVSILLAVGMLILMAMAISPLKAGKKKGWDILFFALLFQAAVIVINAVISLNIVSFLLGIIFGAIGVAAGAYLLFEVKSHFVKIGEKVEEKKEEK